MSWGLGIVVVGVLVVLWVVGIYNRLVRLRNQVDNAWAQIDVQLQRRYDLIPNLVEAVKGYMAHERGTLEAVVEARNQAAQMRKALEQQGGPTGAEGSLEGLMGAENVLQGALAKLFALSESYPDLKANQNMQQLQEELASTENKVAFSRQSYNDQVLAYNTYQQQLPASLLAGTFGHTPADRFLVEEKAAREAPKVSFD